MELKLYQRENDKDLIIMYHNECYIGFYPEDSGNNYPVSYKIENSDIDFVIQYYKLVPWDNKYNKFIIEIFFDDYRGYIKWL